MRLQLQLRTILFAIPILGVVFTLMPIFDAVLHGPYTMWFNQRCQRLAETAKLIGKPEKDILAVLGPPTYYYGSANSDECTYNYSPISIVPYGKFQVHCENGIVVAVEMLDD